MERTSRQLMFVTAESLLNINKLMIEKFGGVKHGISNNNLFYSIVDCNYNQTIYNSELYPDIEDKIACIAHSIICNHVFFDANKLHP